MENGQVLHSSLYVEQIDKFAVSLKQLAKTFLKLEEKKSDWTAQLYKAETSESVQKKRSYDFVSIVSSFRCAGSECSKASCKEYSV